MRFICMLYIFSILFFVCVVFIINRLRKKRGFFVVLSINIVIIVGFVVFVIVFFIVFVVYGGEFYVGVWCICFGIGIIVSLFIYGVWLIVKMLLLIFFFCVCMVDLIFYLKYFIKSLKFFYWFVFKCYWKFLFG